MARALREVRAAFTEGIVRVYQAYSPEIASNALAAQTLVAPFRRGRMTWIKPSFAWMMYRSGWATKAGQERILAIDISRDGFEWALAHSSLSHYDPAIYSSLQAWEARLRSSPVRVQWDPERTLKLEPLPYRTIQIGLGGDALEAYVDQWISKIEDVTVLARQIEALVARDDLERAGALLPLERSYPLPLHIADRIGCTPEGHAV